MMWLSIVIMCQFYMVSCDEIQGVSRESKNTSHKRVYGKNRNPYNNNVRELLILIISYYMP